METFVAKKTLHKFSFVVGNALYKTLAQRTLMKLIAGLVSRRQSHGGVSPEGAGMEITKGRFSATFL